MKCVLCKEKVEETFLNKIKGTYVGSGKKKKVVCQLCQKKYPGDALQTKV